MGHPSFEGSLGLDDIMPGMSFMVWDIARGRVVETGVFVVTNIQKADGYIEKVDIKYRDAIGKERVFEYQRWGLWREGAAADKWSHMMTVPIEYLDRQAELPVSTKRP